MTWKAKAVIVSDRHAEPAWDGDVPTCSDTCIHHDGKRCRLLGGQPSDICAPVVAEMGRMLTELTPHHCGNDRCQTPFKSTRLCDCSCDKCADAEYMGIYAHGAAQ